ncbi:MAG: hypothetical protein GAK28_04069 [Luteibacter sp.]|uniref:hypothetical protein n=1 Tax=Luteibacter sp. TaxID=1886636 RepID=UPI0013846A66|nr:hypothetical protein [Luteibacter sp.]KAF1004362.1 MAG: hypothetical protein GAK28_04069 [Luteibacter sp.]
MKARLKRFLDTLSRNSLVHLLERERHAAELRAQPRYALPGCLTRHEHRAFSQNGEDGAIREIFGRIDHGQFFVEIGVGDGSENNTTFLLAQGWSGVWVEGDAANATTIRQRFAKPLASGQLVLIESFVTAENIETLLAPWAGRDVDLFSLDLDRNTYHVWKALSSLRPRVSVVEYNPIFPPGVEWVVDYAADRWWNGGSCYGASLSALAGLASSKGELLVGCDLTGTNAYFVRSDLCGSRFLDPGNVDTHYEPCRNYLQGRPPGHPRQFSDLS